MTKLYILCGYPFAGKSTIARALVKRFSLVRVALDDITAELGIDVNASRPVTDTERQRSNDVYQQRIIENLQAGKSVIVDTVAYKREHRGKLRLLATENGATPVLLYVNTPRATVRERWLANRQTNARPDVSDEDFYQVVNQFEAPGDAEHPLIITPAMKLEDVLRLLNPSDSSTQTP